MEKTEKGSLKTVAENTSANENIIFGAKAVKKKNLKDLLTVVNRKRLVIIALIFLTILLAIFILVYRYLLQDSQKTTEVFPFDNQDFIETPLTPTSLTPIHNMILTEYLSLYSPQLIARYSNDIIALELFEIGKITGGDFQGDEIYLVNLTYGFGGKGPGSGKPNRLRFIRSGEKLVFIPSISVIKFLDSFRNDEFFKLLSENGWSVETDDSIGIEIFEYPQTLVYQQSDLVYRGEENGTPDLDILVKAFDDPIFGDVYMTKPELSPQKTFYTDEDIPPYKTSGGWGDGILSCVNEECFYTNAFFVFRPDGTYLKYAYIPEIFDAEEKSDWRYRGLEGSLIELNDGHKLRDNYNFYTRMGCSDNEADYISVVSPRVLSKDQLIQAGKIIDTQDPIYILPNEHQLLKDFYQDYKQNRGEWYYMTGEALPDLEISLEDFVASTPLFFWEDPFSRLIRFTNRSFVIPFMCEPVIYIYPEKEQEVTLKLPHKMKLLSTYPEYGSGWTVMVNPRGEITDSDKNIYEYLFWEGVYGIWPENSSGYVVKRENVEEFFIKILPQLGLKNNEIHDFIDAWLPEFQNAPFYKISFYDQKLIDVIIPLDINPRPDTLIRVLMEYKGLGESISLEEPVVSLPPVRKGFTVIEWGGLKR